MAERSALNQVVQLAVEDAPGSGVAEAGGYKQFLTFGIEPSPQVEIDQFRPAGTKYRGFTALGKEWSQGQISGRPSYNELPFLLASVINKPTQPTIAGATNTKAWRFRSDNVQDDTPKTFLVEHGSAFRAERFSHGIITELSFSFSRSGIQASGQFLGRQVSDDITMSASSAVTPMIPVQPTEVTLFVADAYANFAGDTDVYGADEDHGASSLPAGNVGGKTGEGRLVRAISAEWSLGNRYSPVFTLDAISGAGTYGTSFVGTIEREPDLTASIMMEADDEGMGLLEQMRDGDSKFLRIEAVGKQIEAVTGGNGKYKFRLDTSTRVVNTGGFRDSDGLYAIEWGLTGIQDGTWGRAFEALVWNTLTFADLTA